MPDPLIQLARLHGIHTAYHDASGNWVRASDETLITLLKALGTAVEHRDQAPQVLERVLLAHWEQVAPPAQIVRAGAENAVYLRLPADAVQGEVSWTLVREDGGRIEGKTHLQTLPVVRRRTVAGQTFEQRRMELKNPQGAGVLGELPIGYHQLRISIGPREHTVCLLATPEQAYVPEKKSAVPDWGVFIPLYSLHTRHSWGPGNFTDMGKLIDWTAKQGGSIVGTLPMMSCFLGDQAQLRKKRPMHTRTADRNEPAGPFEPSPYSPGSRLFWNEMFIDVEAAPNLRDCPEARQLMQSEAFKTDLRDLRAADFVDYTAAMNLRRQVLELLARQILLKGWPTEDDEDYRGEFARFIQDHPQVENYARFRAVTERMGVPWWEWPEPLKHGTIVANDVEPSVWFYHLFVQWLADRQVRALRERAGEAEVGFYLDMPVGVDRCGYDVWAWREQFALDISAGAPPDVFFSKGQVWGFPPLHPGRIREDGYQYMRNAMRALMQTADVLRIDHVMGLHRMFWVPNGREALHGTYVNYPGNELYAIVCIESHRNKTVIYGEDLGTVPDRVRKAMDRQRFHRMYVGQFSVQPVGDHAFFPVDRNMLASLNTHDMPTWAGWWHGTDIDDRIEMGLLDEGGANHEREVRQWTKDSIVYFLSQRGYLKVGDNVDDVLRAALKYLGDSEASVVLVNLEDLWLERNQQNVPGTWREKPNWRRRARHSFEEMKQMPIVGEILGELNEFLKEKAGGEENSE